MKYVKFNKLNWPPYVDMGSRGGEFRRRGEAHQAHGYILLLEVSCAMLKMIPWDSSAEVVKRVVETVRPGARGSHLHDGAAGTSSSTHDLAAGAGCATSRGGVFAFLGRHFEVCCSEYKSSRL